VAIVTRQLVEEHALFRDKISLAQARSLPVFDRKSFTTIIVLYDVLDGYLGLGRPRWRDFKRVRPSEDDVGTFYAKAAKLWEVIAGRFAPVRELWNSRPADEVASRYRNEQGGHLLFRPIGLRIFTEAMIAFMNGGMLLQGAVDQLALAPMDLGGPPWVGVLWDPINRRMLTSPENRMAATKILFYSVGGNLEVFKTIEEDLTRELAGLLHREPAEVQLPRFV
jgi:DNA sulfur modification protein DndB